MRLGDLRRSSARFDLSVLTTSRIVGAAAQASTLLVVAARVGASDFGLLSLWLGVLLVASALTSLGQFNYVVRAAAEGRQDRLKASFRLSWTAGLSVTMLLCATILALTGEALWCFMAAAFLVERQNDLTVAAHLGRRQMLIPAVFSTARPAIGLAGYLCLSLAVGVDDISSYVVARLVAAIVLNLGTWLMSDKGEAGVQPASILSTLRDIAPMAWANTAGVLRQLDVAVVTTVSGTGTAGVFGLGSRLSTPILLGTDALASILLPRANHGGSAYSRRLCRRVVRLGTIAGTPWVALSMVDADGAFTSVVGDDFSGIFRVMMIMMWATTASATASLIATVLQANNLDRSVAANSLINLPLALSLVAVGALSWGALGGAVGVAMGATLRFATLWWTAEARLANPSARPGAPVAVSDA